MKNLLTATLMAISSVASAQWSNTTNAFYDSLHMPVCIAEGHQTNPIVINSFPDGGYFVIWEDDRNFNTTLTDIYAQKYDAAGTRLWAADGVPVANGPNYQRYSSQLTYDDYRTRSYAATDSAGGFYICYIDDSLSNFSNYWPRIAVQHMQSSGIPAFPGAGFIMRSPISYDNTYTKPQLIADGIGGFFISYVRDGKYLYVDDCKEIGGTIKYFGSAQLNQNGVEHIDTAGKCYPRHYIENIEFAVTDYNIWSDGERGCNAVFSLVDGTLGYNRFWRAKKNARVSFNYYQSDGEVNHYGVTLYDKDSVYLLYKLQVNAITKKCAGDNPIVLTSEYLRSNGFQLLDDEGYNYSFLRGVTVFTPGNMNVDFMACAKRILRNNVYSEDVVVGYTIRTNKLDSVPFQRASYTDPNFSFNTMPPPDLNKVNLLRDTLLFAPEAGHNVNFSLAAGGKNIFAAALMGQLSGNQNRLVKLQHLSVESISADSFAILYKTPKAGETIGQEAVTGFVQTSISYGFPPFVSVNKAGSNMFYINEQYRYIRVSPIGAGADLLWGAMGKPLGSGTYTINSGSSNYSPEFVVAALHPTDGTGVIAWQDNRSTGPNSAGNIFMRHIDQLSTPQYVPPIKAVKLLTNPYGALTAFPVSLIGTSKQYTTIEVNNPSGNVSGVSTVAEILDNYNLGLVQTSVFQHSDAIPVRRYNKKPYLNRNYTITPRDNPRKPGSINLRLYFATTEFTALRHAARRRDSPPPDRQQPFEFNVRSQPNNTLSVPSEYTPVAGEKLIRPVAMEEVEGGYYLEIVVNGFSNFFIEYAATKELCAGGDGNIISDIAGNSYQWQVDTDIGFVNLTDNSNYSGTNTDQLVLTNIPSSWSGYKYRCIASGDSSEVITLLFSSTWKGGEDNNWETAANWSCGTVPDANTDVYINSGTVLLNSNRSCRSITINPGATLNVNPVNKLTVTD